MGTKLILSCLLLAILGSCNPVTDELTVLASVSSDNELQEFKDILKSVDEKISDRYPASNEQSSYRTFLDSLIISIKERHRIIELFDDKTIKDLFEEMDIVFRDELFAQSNQTFVDENTTIVRKSVRLRNDGKYFMFLEKLAERSPEFRPYIEMLFNLNDPQNELRILTLAHSNLNLTKEERLIIGIEYLVLSSNYFPSEAYPDLLP
ncbi:hypothetical protein N8482_03360 [Chitinophagales bacterium]|nr:hypothetical protein [Chitinophagales bacterium]